MPYAKNRQAFNSSRGRVFKGSSMGRGRRRGSGPCVRPSSRSSCRLGRSVKSSYIVPRKWGAIPQEPIIRRPYADKP